MNKFTSYKVNTQVNATHPNFPFQSSAVVRRYSDFVWLVDQLMKEYAGAVVPPIPEKQAVSRFSPEFVEGRRKMLEQVRATRGVGRRAIGW
jgi:sorting nexin-1/2